MQQHIGGEALAVKEAVWERLRKEPLFAAREADGELPREALVELTFRRVQRLYEMRILELGEEERHLRLAFAVNEALWAVDPALGNKFGLQAGLFRDALLNLGTERHRDLLESIAKYETVGCFALTGMVDGRCCA